MEAIAGICQEREILKSRYRADLKVYSQAIHQLDTCEPGEFNQTYKLVERARTAFANARNALEEHVAKHGCG